MADGAGGFDKAIIGLLNDVGGALSYGVVVFCGLAGSIVLFGAIKDSIEMAKWRSDVTPLQNIGEYAVASVLLAITSFFAATGGMNFVSGDAPTGGYAVVEFQTGGGVAGASEAAAAGNALMAAVLAFLSVIGRITQVRGVLAARDLGRGRSDASEWRVVGLLVLGTILADLSPWILGFAKSINLSILS